MWVFGGQIFHGEVGHANVASQLFWVHLPSMEILKNGSLLFGKYTCLVKVGFICHDKKIGAISD
jgi:hypothetical protein